MTLVGRASREDEVWARLARVMDPELDEPITDMGFVERVAESDRDEVEVEFRLPTYWCSPNFAFLMADGIHREVLALEWVARVGVRLQDHMYADEINRGVNDGRRFATIFGELSDGGDLEELRARFEEKAFQRRQEAVLLGLRELGRSAADIAAMDLGTFDALELGGEAAAQKPRYRELLIKKGLAAAPDDLAFRTVAGQALAGDALAGYLAELRGVRLNMELNGVLCRGLSKARYKTVSAGGGQPTIVDFCAEPAGLR